MDVDGRVLGLGADVAGALARVRIAFWRCRLFAETPGCSCVTLIRPARDLRRMRSRALGGDWRGDF